MIVKAKAVKLATEMGATIGEPSCAWGEYRLELDSPAGKVFRSDGVHCRVCIGYSRNELWQDALEVLEFGLSECMDPDCEYCHPVLQTE